MYIKNILKIILPGIVIMKINQLRKQLRTRRYRGWASKYVVNLNKFMQQHDHELAVEAIDFANNLEVSSVKLLESVPFKQGGGGAYSLLYFLTKYHMPKISIETGVASGWSSTAILSGIKTIEGAMLYSSDLPYNQFGGEEAIGVLIPNDLKHRWELCKQGDKHCLPKIIEKAEFCDMFHYDSDKSYEGREYAWSIIKPLLSPEAIVIFDDIQDNFHFRDLVRREKYDFKVFEFGGKYIGYLLNNESR
jgi:predicted O-methyltransferase YrrM